jgi:phage prohead protease, HK97 family
MFRFKDAPNFEIKDIDPKMGLVKGVLSKFGVVDAHGDMLMPGAFKKSCAERGPKSGKAQKIAFLRSHNTDAPVGKFTDLQEDSDGLVYEAKMSESTLGRDTLTLMAEGIMNNHSIGYLPIPDKEEQKEEYNEIREVKLMEGSVLVFGANSETPVMDVKELEPKQALEKLTDKMDRIIRVIRKGAMHDDTYMLLEIELEQLKTLQNALVKQEPGQPTLSLDKPLEFKLDAPSVDFSFNF